MKLVIKSIIFGIIILMIDIPWLLFYMKDLYKQLFKRLNLKMSGNMIAAIIAYSIMILSYPFLIYDKDETIMVKRAGLLGFVIYGVYGFTLSAFLPKYNMSFAIKETVWGTLLYIVATKLTNVIYKYIR